MIKYVHPTYSVIFQFNFYNPPIKACLFHLKRLATICYPSTDSAKKKEKRKKEHETYTEAVYISYEYRQYSKLVQRKVTRDGGGSEGGVDELCE